MNTIKVLIVEDEILIAETIAAYLKERGHDILDIAVSFEEAVKSLSENKPDVALLDIRLYGEKSGLDLGEYINGLEDPPPFIYLTSQYDKRIVEQAMHHDPSGYLIKPIHKESLWTTVESAASKSKKNENYILLFDGKINHRINPDEILYVQAEHVYANVHMSNGQKITTRSSLQSLLDIIKLDLLIQCHRSYLVNLSQIDRWNKASIYLKDNTEIPLSRSKRQLIKDKLFSVQNAESK